MIRDAAQSGRSSLRRLAAIYLFSLPVALTLTPVALPWEPVVAILATSLGWILGLAPWWLVINAFFVPALSWGLSFDFSPLWPLALLTVLVLVYGGIWKTRVPLFFSSRRAQDALLALLPPGRISLLDVGCGDARVIAKLASGRPESRFEGVEQAFVPWLLGRLRCRLFARSCRVRRADLWTCHLGAYDVVYAYLSPAVMADFWAKAQKEMRAGALLVSAFAVAEVRPDSVIEVDDAMGTRLNVWRMRPRAKRPGRRRSRKS